MPPPWSRHGHLSGHRYSIDRIRSSAPPPSRLHDAAVAIRHACASRLILSVSPLTTAFAYVLAPPPSTATSIQSPASQTRISRLLFAPLPSLAEANKEKRGCQLYLAAPPNSSSLARLPCKIERDPILCLSIQLRCHHRIVPQILANTVSESADATDNAIRKKSSVFDPPARTLPSPFAPLNPRPNHKPLNLPPRFVDRFLLGQISPLASLFFQLLFTPTNFIISSSSSSVFLPVCKKTAVHPPCRPPSRPRLSSLAPKTWARHPL